MGYILSVFDASKILLRRLAAGHYEMTRTIQAGGQHKGRILNSRTGFALLLFSGLCPIISDFVSIR